MRIVYDPAVITFNDLLEIFWTSHNPCHSSAARQYRSAVFYESDEQRQAAERSMDREQKNRKKGIVTDIAPLGTFYPAEEYHQKYSLRGHRPLMKELGRLYPDFTVLRATTLAARTNAYLGGHLTLEEYGNELRRLELSEDDMAKILKAAASRR